MLNLLRRDFICYFHQVSSYYGTRQTRRGGSRGHHRGCECRAASADVSLAVSSLGVAVAVALLLLLLLLQPIPPASTVTDQALAALEIVVSLKPTACLRWDSNRNVVDPAK